MFVVKNLACFNFISFSFGKPKLQTYKLFAKRLSSLSFCISWKSLGVFDSFILPGIKNFVMPHTAAELVHYGKIRTSDCMHDSSKLMRAI
jgi:hypothetical protein